ncbi:uncharacterized protein LOC113602861 [Acinonyx jubatus]|uniref:Uncharacterized protein LOC113602861 n=1 Tax=Acinonyx jubatus TaxID=32536 RepID=A0A6J2AG47_ACIJB|nr:uncharacterized protein LOC113602861 [Acinonyx jubatus]
MGEMNPENQQEKCFMRLEAIVTRGLLQGRSTIGRLSPGEGLKGAWGRAEAEGLPFFAAEASLGAGPGASSGHAPSGGLGPASVRDVPQGPVRRGRSGPARPESDRAVGGSGAADWHPGGLAVQRPGCVGPTSTRCQPRNLSGGQIWGRDPHLLESVRPLPAACPGAKRSQGALGVRPLGTPSSSCTTEGLLPSDAVKLSMDHFCKQIASGENRHPLQGHGARQNSTSSSLDGPWRKTVVSDVHSRSQPASSALTTSRQPSPHRTDVALTCWCFPLSVILLTAGPAFTRRPLTRHHAWLD